MLDIIATVQAKKKELLALSTNTKFRSFVQILETWNPHKNPIPHQLNKELRSGCSALYDKGMGLNKASEPSDNASTNKASKPTKRTQNASTNEASKPTKRTQNASTNEASKPTKRTQKASTNNNNKVEFNDDSASDESSSDSSEFNCTVVRGKKRIANQKRGPNKRCKRK
eukprot:620609_1